MFGNGNGKKGKKIDRLARASERPKRDFSERVLKAGPKERKKLGLSK